MGTRIEMPVARAGKRRGALLRLQSALHSGTGHLAVTAETREEAAHAVDAALREVETFTVLRVHASVEDPLAELDDSLGFADRTEVTTLERRRALTDLIAKARVASRPIFAVVDDADEVDAEALERTRMSLECAPDAIERLRIVLIGSPRLDVSLTDPAASALASRLGTRVRLAPPAAAGGTASSATQSGFRAAAVAVLTAAIVLPFARVIRSARDVVPSPPAPPLQTAAVGERADGERRDEHVARGAEAPPGPGGERAKGPPIEHRGELEGRESSGDKKAREAPVRLAAATEAPRRARDDSTPALLASEESRRASLVVRRGPHDDGATAQPRAERAAVSEASGAEARDARAPTTAGDAAVSRPRAQTAQRTGRPVERDSGAPAGSTSRTAAVSARLAPADSASRAAVAQREAARAAPALQRAHEPSVIMQAGAFQDVWAAYILQRKLAAHVEHVHVARLDPPQGPVYSVRVLGLDDSGDIARVEHEIRSLGHEPVRLEPRDTRSFWARLFGRR